VLQRDSNELTMVEPDVKDDGSQGLGKVPEAGQQTSVNLSNKIFRNEITFRFECHRPKDEQKFNGAAAAKDTIMNMFEHMQGSLEVMAHTDGRRITESTQYPEEAKEQNEFFIFGDSKKKKNGVTIFPMFIKVTTSVPFGRVRSKMLNWLKTKHMFINKHDLKTRSTKDIGFLINCNMKEKLWGDIQCQLYEAMATEHCAYVDKDPSKTNLSTIMSPIELSPRPVHQTNMEGDKKVIYTCYAAVIVVDDEHSKHLLHLLEETKLPEQWIFVPFGIEQKLMVDQIQIQNKHTENIGHVAVKGLATEHLNSKTDPSELLAVEHIGKKFAQTIMDVAKNKKGDQLVLSVERTQTTEEAGLIFLVCHDDDKEELNEWVDNNMAQLTQGCCADYHIDAAIQRFSTVPTRVKHDNPSNSFNKANARLKADPTIKAGQFQQHRMRNRKPAPIVNELVLDTTGFPELSKTPTNNAWGIQSATTATATTNNSQQGNKQQTTATAKPGNNNNNNNDSPQTGGQAMTPETASGRTSPSTSMQTADNLSLMTEISSMNSTMSSAVQSIATITSAMLESQKTMYQQIKANDEERKSQRQFQNAFLKLQDKREQRATREAQQQRETLVKYQEASDKKHEQLIRMMAGKATNITTKPETRKIKAEKIEERTKARTAVSKMKTALQMQTVTEKGEQMDYNLGDDEGVFIDMYGSDNEEDDDTDDRDEDDGFYDNSEETVMADSAEASGKAYSPRASAQKNKRDNTGRGRQSRVEELEPANPPTTTQTSNTDLFSSTSDENNLPASGTGEGAMETGHTSQTNADQLPRGANPKEGNGSRQE
jgi:hypothetical protein